MYKLCKYIEDEHISDDELDINHQFCQDQLQQFCDYSLFNIETHEKPFKTIKLFDSYKHNPKTEP